jgi:RNA polymerase sigma-70 factor, ECF subfamily
MVYGDCMMMALSQSDYEFQPLLRLLISAVRAMAAEFIPVVIGEECPAVLHDDMDLVRRSKDGDHDAFSQLIQRHQPSVSRIMWRFSRDEAVHEELVQDVFVEAYLSLATYSAKAPLANWLARIATRVGYRHWTAKERDSKQCHMESGDWDLLSKEDARHDDPTASAELLHHLLAGLPPRDRLVLTLRYLEDCSIEEAARRAGWSITMTKVQCWRAMQKLTALFERYRKETGI